jgi:(S)-ureidoglycine aminohydrolase
MPDDATAALFGATRTRLATRHALIAPDGRMNDGVPGWRGARTTVLISPRLGAGRAPEFVQLIAALDDGGGAGPAPAGVERFAYVLEGAVDARLGERRERLGPGGYAFAPAGMDAELTADGAARLLVFEKRYLPARDGPGPEAVVGDAADAEPRPFLGLEGVTGAALLPDAPAYDLSLTLMRYRPGAALPLVETHEAEHGLLLLEGGGILRLGESWYPVRAGDAVWMGPYCPQWFAALGERDAVYLLYKDGRRGAWAAMEPRG